jgi:hypothetical protein
LITLCTELQHALFAEAQAEAPGFAFVVRSMEVIGGR